MSVKALLLLAAVALAACGPQTQRTPSLAPAADAPPAKRGLFEEAGDTTWRVVTAPGRMLTPQPKPQPQPPQTYDAPAAVFSTTWTDDAPATQPIHP